MEDSKGGSILITKLVFSPMASKLHRGLKHWEVVIENDANGSQPWLKSCET
jgi:hypothetical protein